MWRRVINAHCRYPIYTLSPDGHSAVTPDFRRINDMRPGYGYAGLPDPFADQLAPQEGGIHRLDLESGKVEQIVSLSEIAAIPYPHGEISEAKHYFNHLLFSPDGSRFIFLHRWRFGEGAFHTRMCTAAADGSDIRVVDDSGHTSHFIWRDPQHILAWSYHPSHDMKFYLYRDQDGPSAQPEVVGLRRMTVNGHCTYLADQRVDPERHLPGCGSTPRTLPLPCTLRTQVHARPLSCTCGVRGRMALRPAPAHLAGWAFRLHRLNPRR